VAIPTSFFERDGHHFYNTLAMIDADGEIMGTYRKSHIPDGPGYEEKYYFRPGNTGFRVWDVFGARIGIGICWDQWYPECARAMALMGAEVLFYPPPSAPSPMTRSGHQPHVAPRDDRPCGEQLHAGGGSNRIGVEGARPSTATASSATNGAICWAIMARGCRRADRHAGSEPRTMHRAGMGFFRDRRPQLYGRLAEDI
jgi:N-carbamoylputrescine amidase